jgi:hypothetical protein
MAAGKKVLPIVKLGVAILNIHNIAASVRAEQKTLISLYFLHHTFFQLTDDNIYLSSIADTGHLLNMATFVYQT